MNDFMKGIVQNILASSVLFILCRIHKKYRGNILNFTDKYFYWPIRLFVALPIGFFLSALISGLLCGIFDINVNADVLLPTDFFLLPFSLILVLTSLSGWQPKIYKKIVIFAIDKVK